MEKTFPCDFILYPTEYEQFSFWKAWILCDYFPIVDGVSELRNLN